MLHHSLQIRLAKGSRRRSQGRRCEAVRAQRLRAQQSAKGHNGASRCRKSPLLALKCRLRVVDTLQKEEVLDHIKKIYLPYTVIDVGWWYQSTLPRLPSGKIDYALTFPMANVYGDGNFPSALTDLRDVGKYVARIIADPRTLNKSVFVYNEVLTQEQIFTLLEKASGEKIPREYLSKEEIEATIAAASKKFYDEEWSLPNLLGLVVVQYANSVWLRGDNTPESAEYLGYLSGKELYPDVETIKFERYVAEVLAGNGKATYANRSFDFGTKDGEDKK